MTDTVPVNCRVLSINPVARQNLIALADVEIEICEIAFVLHGVQIIRAKKDGKEATAVKMPTYRDHAGVWNTALSMPSELEKPIADAILNECIAMGILKRLSAG